MNKKQLEKEGWIEHKTFWAKKFKYGTFQIPKKKKEENNDTKIGRHR
jgi:hypothetical protein